MVANDALPCPFCGAVVALDPEGITAYPGDVPTFAVGCDECIAFGPKRDNHADSVYAWNQRQEVSMAAAKGLAPCPFCGGAARIARREERSWADDSPMIEYEATCPSCAAWAMGARSAEEARAGWNRRVPRT